MEPKKSKYDTNPLDPNFVKKTEDLGSQDNSGPANIYSEAPTRRYDNVPLESPYQSVFVPPTYSQPAPYQPPAAPYRPVTQKPTDRSVAGLGLPEKWAIMLPYAPFFIGVVPPYF